MSKGIIGGIAGLVLIAIGGVGLPYYCGLKFEQEFRAAVANSTGTLPFPIEITRYDRGLYTATAETRIRIPRAPAVATPLKTAGEAGAAAKPAPRPPLVIVLHHDIRQGPRFDGFRAIQMRTVPVLPEALQKALVKPLHGRPIIEAVDDFGFDGALHGRLTSPAIETTVPGRNGAAASALVWNGLSGLYSLSADGQRLKLDVSAPKFSVDQASDSVALDAIGISASMTRGSVAGLWLGDSGMSIAGLHGVAGTWPFAAQSIMLKSTTAEQDGVMNSTSEFSAARVDGGDRRFDRPLLRVSLANIDSAAYYEGIRGLQAISAKAGDPASKLPQMIAVMRQVGGRLALRQPIFSIDELSVQSAEGKTQASGQVRYVGDGAAEHFSPVTDLSAKLSLETPAATFDQLLAAALESRRHGNTSADAADSDPAAPPALQTARSTREQFVARHLLQLDGDRLRTDIDYRAGRLLVNGTPFRGFGPAPAVTGK